MDRCNTFPETAHPPLDGRTDIGYPVHFAWPSSTQFPVYDNPNGEAAGDQSLELLETYRTTGPRKWGRRRV